MATNRQQVILQYIIQAQNQAQQAFQAQNAALAAMQASLVAIQAQATATANAMNGMAGSQQNATRTAVAQGVVIGELATKGFLFLKDAVESSIESASRFQNTFIGLDSIAKHFGQNIDDTREAAKDLASDGLLRVDEAAQGLKNLLAAGFGLPEAIDLMHGFKDAASFNRQASLDFGYAITSATEGIKNQNSILVDNVGLTKNLTIIMREQGLAVADLAKVSTDAAVREKFRIGLLKELSQFSGDAIKLTDTYSGSVTKLKTQMQLASAAIGEGFLPIVKLVADALVPIAKFLQENAAAVQKLVVVLASAGTAYFAVTKSIQIYQNALIALQAAQKVAAAGNVSIVAALGLTGPVLIGIAAALAAATAAWYLYNRAHQSVDYAQRNKDIETNIQKLEAAKDKIEALSSSQLSQDEILNKSKEIYAEATLEVDKVAKSVDSQKEAIDALSNEMQGFKTNTFRNNISDADQTLAQFGITADAVNQKLKELQRTHVRGPAPTADIARDAVIREQVQQIEVFRDMAKAAQKDAASSLLGPSPASFDPIIKKYQEQIDKINNAATSRKTFTDRMLDAKTVDAEAAGRLADYNHQLQVFAEQTSKGIYTNEQFTKAIDDLDTAYEAALLNGLNQRQTQHVLADEEKKLAEAEIVYGHAVSQRTKETLRGNAAIELQISHFQDSIKESFAFSEALYALNKSVRQQTTGVESTQKQWSLLTSAMKTAHVEFSSSLDALRPFHDILTKLAGKTDLTDDEFNQLTNVLRRFNNESPRTVASVIEFENAISASHRELVKINQEIELFGKRNEQLPLGAVKDLVDKLQGIADKPLNLPADELAHVNELLDIYTAELNGVDAQTIITNQALENYKRHLTDITDGAGSVTSAFDLLIRKWEEAKDKGPAAVSELIPELEELSQRAGLTEEQFQSLLNIFNSTQVATVQSAKSLADYRKHLDDITVGAQSTGAEINAALKQLNLAEATGDQRAIDEILDKLDELAHRADITGDAFTQLSGILKNYARDPLKEVRDAQANLEASNLEFQDTVTKIGRETVEQQIRSAEVGAQKQVAIIKKQIDDMQIQWKRYKLNNRKDLADITKQQIDAARRQAAAVKAQAATQVADLFIGTEDFDDKLRAMVEGLSQFSGDELEVAQAHVDAFVQQFDDEVLPLLKKLSNQDKNIEKVLTISHTLAGAFKNAGFDKIADAIDKITDATDHATKAGDRLAATLQQIKVAREHGQKAFTFDNVANLAQGTIEGISSVLEATSSQSRLQNALGGAISGAMLGFKIGNFITPGAGGVAGLIVGGIAGAIVGAFRNTEPEWKKISNHVANLFGTAVSQATAEAIEATKVRLQLSFKDAALLNLGAIIDEAGGYLAKENQFTGDALELLQRTQELFNNSMTDVFGNSINQGNNLGAAAEGIEQLGKVFGQMVDSMDRLMDGVVDPDMVLFIQRAKEAKYRIKELDDFLEKMADQSLKGVNDVVNGFLGQINAGTKNVEDSVNKIYDLASQKASIITRMNLLSPDSRAYKDLARQLEEVQRQFEDVSKSAQQSTVDLNNSLGDPAQVEDRVNRMGRLLNITFQTAQASGKSFLEALTGISPALDQITAAQQKFGFETSDTVKHLQDLNEWAIHHADLAQSIDGLNQLMTGLANQAALTQDTFTDLTNEVSQQFADLQKSGLDYQDSLQFLQPTLQKIFELQKRFGFTVDDTTQSLLDQAQAAGIVGTAQESVYDRLNDTMKDLTDAVKDLTSVMITGHLPTDTSQQTGLVAVPRPTPPPANALGVYTEDVTPAINTTQAAATVNPYLQLMLGGQEQIQKSVQTTATSFDTLSRDAGSQLGALATSSNTALNTVTSSAQASADSISDISNSVDELKATAVQQMQPVTAAVDSTNDAVGSLVDSLQNAIDVFNKAGDEGTAALDSIAKALHDLQDNLSETQLEGFALDIFQLDRQHREAIQQWLEASKNEAQEIIDSGLSLINQTFDNKMQKLQTEQTKKLQGIMFDIDNQLFDLTVDNAAAAMHDLEVEQYNAVQKFLDDTKGASQDFIDEGLDKINQIFALRAQKLREEARGVQDVAQAMTPVVTALGNGLLRIQGADVVFGDLNNMFDSGAQAAASWAADTVASAGLVFDAINAVSWGHSPGGIKQLAIEYAKANAATDSFAVNSKDNLRDVKNNVDSLSDLINKNLDTDKALNVDVIPKLAQDNVDARIQPLLPVDITTPENARAETVQNIFNFEPGSFQFLDGSQVDSDLVEAMMEKFTQKIGTGSHTAVRFQNTVTSRRR